MHKLLLLFLLFTYTQAQNYNIAILSIFDKERTEKEWQPTIDYLNREIPKNHFTLIPVPFKNLHKFKKMILNKKIDYLLTNPLIYVNLELTTHISKIATLVKNKGVSEFGSVIITRADSNISTIKDIKNRTIAGIGKDGFGGWLVAYNELLQNGFDPYKEAKQVLFLGTQGKILNAVLNKKVDVGIIRTGIIEDAIKNKIITPKTFKIINQKHYKYFHQLCSSKLYPEWAFAKTSYAPKDVTQKIKNALLSMKSNSLEAQSAHYWKWTIPYSYESIHTIMKNLSIGEYKKINSVTIHNILLTYKNEIIIFFIFSSVILLTLILIIYQKNTTLRKEVKKNINMLNHDYLTGLYNRHYMYKNQDKWLRDTSQKLAIIFVDLDNFKNINDTFGHNYGDLILIEVANRISSYIDKKTIAIRQGGDEFIIIKPIDKNEDIQLYIQELTYQISSSYHIDGLDFRVGCSAGVSMFPQHSLVFNDLLSFADIAMYKAKENKNSFLLFNDIMKKDHLQTMLIEQELRSAIQRDELYMLYQPQIDRNKNLYGVEALVRWTNPKLGKVNTQKFISIAEDSGLMIELGNFIIERSLLEISHLQQELNKKFHLSINISVKQLVEENFLEKIHALVQKSDLKNEFITLEVTETIFIKDLNYIIPILNKLVEDGFKIALDDFGTGFSSLNILQQLPINELKIDKSFIDKIQNPKNKLMLQSIIKIGKDLNMILVAEGVETIEQVDIVNSLECDIIQGYYYSKPLSISEIKVSQFLK